MADDKATILIQMDVDPQPSVFDAVVAVDAKVDHLFRHGDVTPENVQDLVYGALFTRGPSDLRRTALFVGGSDVAKAEAVLAKVRSTFFGPFRVSVLFDANGSNTTAAAAVLAATSSLGGSLAGAKAAVLAATGPVGQRVARLLGRGGATVAVGSRDLARAGKLAERLGEATPPRPAPRSKGRRWSSPRAPAASSSSRPRPGGRYRPSAWSSTSTPSPRRGSRGSRPATRGSTATVSRRGARWASAASR